MDGDGASYDEELAEILASDLPELEKLVQAFGRVTGSIVDYAQREVELAKAMHDREAMIKAQIKMQTMNSARGIFQSIYWRLTGRKAWDE